MTTLEVELSKRDLLEKSFRRRVGIFGMTVSSFLSSLPRMLYNVQLQDKMTDSLVLWCVVTQFQDSSIVASAW